MPSGKKTSANVRFPTEKVTLTFRDRLHRWEMEVDFEMDAEHVQRFIDTWRFGGLDIWNATAASDRRRMGKVKEEMRDQQLRYAGYESSRTSSRTSRRKPRG